MNLIEILSILGIHWLADFVLQTDNQAKGKSKEWLPLLSHTFNYSSIWFSIGTIWSISSNVYTDYSYLFDWWIVWKFSIITFICHTVTDYITSRENAKLWEQGKVHNFFVSLGFDQYLHYIQLFITYWYLTK